MGKRDPKVSVIVPAYGHEEYILESIASVRRQSFTDFEIIVVNDGSPDGTAGVLRPLVGEGVIRYIEQENRGQSVARNRGLEEARGEYIAFLDDDDVWPDNKLEWQVSVLDQKPEILMVYGGMTPFWGEAGSSETLARGVASEPAPSGEVEEAFARRNWIVSPGQSLIRATAIEEAGGFDPEIWGADDYDLYLTLASLGPFYYEHRVALYYRKHAGNASHKVGLLYRNVQAVRRKHRRKGSRSPVSWWHSESYTRRYFSVRFFSASSAASARGEVCSAIVMVGKGLWVWPPGLLRRRFWDAVSNIGKGLFVKRKKEGDPPDENASRTARQTTLPPA